MTPRVKRGGAFARWMDRKGAPAAKVIATYCGVSVKTIYAYRSGRYLPSLEVAHRISELSGGAVGTGDWPERAAARAPRAARAR